MSLFTLALAFHVVTGVLALVTLPLPVFSRKGSPLHRRAGWVFVAAIGAGAASSLLLCALRLTDDLPGNDAGALFLAYVGLITGTSAWFGIRALRRRLEARSPVDAILPVLLLVGGASLLVFAWHRGTVLFGIYALGGMALAAQLLAVWRRPPSSRLESLLLHVTSLGGSCAATVTATVVVNAERLGLAHVPLVPWLAPGAVATFFIVGARRRLRQRVPSAPSAAALVNSP